MTRCDGTVPERRLCDSTSGMAAGLARAILCASYGALLLFLLLTEDPSRLIPEEWELREAANRLEPAAHLILFAPLGILASAHTTPARRKLGFALAVAFAITVEALQAPMPGREPQWTDCMASLVGLGLGAGVCWMLRSIRYR